MDALGFNDVDFLPSQRQHIRIRTTHMFVANPYGTRLCASVDILGFRELVEDSVQLLGFVIGDHESATKHNNGGVASGATG